MQSPSTHFLIPNYPPRPSDDSAVRAIISRLEDSIIVLSDQIARVQHELSALVSEREKVSRAAEAYRSLVSPAARVPTEILHHIFWLVYSDYYEANFNIPSSDRGSLSSQKSPWLLAQICRRWRAVVLDYPRLWSRIQLDLDKFPGHKRHKRPIARLSAQIERARDHHLSLEVRCTGSMESHTLLCFLLTTSSRWESARFHLTPSLASCLNKCKGRFPVLKSVEMDFNNGWEGSSDSIPRIDAFEEAPQLSTLILLNLQRPILFDRLCFPWKNLVYLEVVAGIGPAIAPAIPLLINVKSCSLLRCTDLTMDEMCLQTIKLPSMRYLRYPAGLRADYLRTLCLPSLEEFQTDLDKEVQVPRFLDFFQRSGFVLTRLCISFMECKANSLITILSYLLQLTSLEVTFSNLCLVAVERLSEALTAKRGCCALLPRLRNLTMRNATYNTPDMEYPDTFTILTMIKSRWDVDIQNRPSTSYSLNSTDNLQRVGIGRLGSWSNYAIDQLLIMSKQGLVVELSGWLEDDPMGFPRLQRIM